MYATIFTQAAAGDTAEAAGISSVVALYALRTLLRSRSARDAELEEADSVAAASASIVQDEAG